MRLPSSICIFFVSILKTRGLISPSYDTAYTVVYFSTSPAVCVLCRWRCPPQQMTNSGRMTGSTTFRSLWLYRNSLIIGSSLKLARSRTAANLSLSMCLVYTVQLEDHQKSQKTKAACRERSSKAMHVCTYRCCSLFSVRGTLPHSR